MIDLTRSTVCAANRYMFRLSIPNTGRDNKKTRKEKEICNETESIIM